MAGANRETSDAQDIPHVPRSPVRLITIASDILRPLKREAIAGSKHPISSCRAATTEARAAYMRGVGRKDVVVALRIGEGVPERAERPSGLPVHRRVPIPKRPRHGAPRLTVAPHGEPAPCLGQRRPRRVPPGPPPARLRPRQAVPFDNAPPIPGAVTPPCRPRVARGARALLLTTRRRAVVAKRDARAAPKVLSPAVRDTLKPQVRCSRVGEVQAAVAHSGREVGPLHAGEASGRPALPFVGAIAARPSPEEMVAATPAIDVRAEGPWPPPPIMEDQIIPSARAQRSRDAALLGRSARPCAANTPSPIMGLPDGPHEGPPSTDVGDPRACAIIPAWPRTEPSA